MALETILSQELIQRLGWTLLHFVWQATAVALLWAILLAFLRKATANIRYIMACVALGLIVLLPIVTMSLVPVSALPPIPSIAPPPAPVAARVKPTIEEIPLAGAVEYEEPMPLEGVRTAPGVPWKRRALQPLELTLPYLVTGWLIGVFGLSVWHLGGWAQLQRLKRHMVKPVDALLLAKLNDLAARLRVSRAIRLMESGLVQVPTVVGWLRPVILLPASALTGLTTEQLEALLAHELAHVRRYDYLVNMLQTIVETLGFYHPAVWWVSHKIRTERENCCDDLAIAITGDRVRYARALTSMEEIRSTQSELAVAATGGNLFSRIRRLIGKDSIERTFSWIPAATVILLLAALIISTTLALTTNEKLENEPSNAEKIDSSTKVLIETQIIHVSDEFLKQVGLDADSLKNSNSWTQYRVDDSVNPTMFVIDSHTKARLLKNVDESENSSSISRIFLMAMSGREATIKNYSGYDFKSQELGRFIKIKPELSQDGQSTSLDCELLIRRFKNFDLFSDVYINKKVDRNDVSESEIFKYQVNAENALLTDNQTLLILGGKQVSLRDVENRKPVLRHISVTGEFVNTTSKIEGQANEIVLVKTTIVSPEQSDDIDAKASSYNVAKIDKFQRIYLDLHDLEAGQYVEIKDSGEKEFTLKQVTTDSIGKDIKDFPAYASYIDFEIRSNFDSNLAIERFTRGSLFEHDKWDAYFVSPDTITGNGHFSPTVLCVCTWSFKIWKHSPLDTVDDTQVSLVAVSMKPNKPQKPSADDNGTLPSAQSLLEKMLEHRARVKNLQYVAEDVIWRDPAAEQVLIEEQIKRMREKGTSERLLEHLRQSVSQAPETRYQILTCTIDDAGHTKIELTTGTFDSSGKKVPGDEKHVWAWNGVVETEFIQRDGSPGSATIKNKPHISTALWHPWKSITGTLCKFLDETITAERQVNVETLKDDTYRVTFDYKTSRYVAIIDPSKGHTCARQESYDTQGRLTSRETATYEEVAEGIWFPVSGQREEFTAEGAVRHRSTATSTQIRINDPAFNASYFNVNVPKGAHVRDFTRNAERPDIYRYGEPRKGYDDIVQSDKKFVAGFVVDENGLPVPGVRLEVCSHKQPKADGKFSWTFGGFEIFNAVTDSRGRFAIEFEEDGFYNLRFSPENHAGIMAYDVPVGTKDLKVTLPKGGTISGRVVRIEDGRKVPIPSVEVKVEQSSRDTYYHLGFNRDRKTMTDAQGRFHFDHLRMKMRDTETRYSKQWEYSPRAWTLSCEKTTKTILFYEGANTEDIELVLKPDYSNPVSLIDKPLSKSEHLNKDMDRILSDPKAATFQMTWHGGGAGRREGMAVEPACLRVYEVQILDNPPPEAIELAGSEARYGRIEFEDLDQTKFTCGLRKSSERVADPDIFFIDMNHNGHLEKEEVHKGIPIYENLDKIHYGVIDIPLKDRNQSRTHRAFVWYGKYDNLYLVSHCYMQGRIRLGDKDVTAVLVDYNCDGRYDSNQGLPGHDRIGWDADGDGKIDWTEQHFIGSHLICGGDVFQVGCTPDGRTVAVIPVEVPMGRLHMPTQNAFVRFVGDTGPINLRITDGAIDVPAGTYQVDYLYIEETDDNDQVSRLSKFGQYFDKPWDIRPGVTTDISRERCIITDRDKRNYEARMRELRGEGPQPRIASLLDEPLRNVDEFTMDVDPAKLKNRRLVICFWDIDQRPSRNVIGELAKREGELADKNVTVLLVHTSGVDPAKLREWLDNRNIPFPCGSIQNDAEEALYNWGVRAQPWLIVTDEEGVVRAEGLSLQQLDAILCRASSSGPVDVEPETGGWENIGELIPPDFNDTKALTEQSTLGAIGQDCEGRAFITCIRDATRAIGRRHRFVLIQKNGAILEPSGYTTFGPENMLEEKFSFNVPFRPRDMDGFRFQSRPLPHTGIDDRLFQLQQGNAAAVGQDTLVPSKLAPPGRCAIELDGIDDYLLVPDSPSLRLEPPFTVEMWIKTKLPADASKDYGGWVILSKGYYVGTPRAWVTGFGIVFRRDPEDPSKLHVDYVTANNSGLYSQTYGTRSLLGQGKSDWIHLFHVFDTGKYKSTPGHPLVIGKFLIPTTRPLMGQIGEIRIWNGARTRDELRRYEKVALTGSESDLAAWWTFEQTDGQFAYDMSGNRNHARLGASPEADDADPKWIDLKAPDAAEGEITNPLSSNPEAGTTAVRPQGPSGALMLEGFYSFGEGQVYSKRLRQMLDEAQTHIEQITTGHENEDWDDAREAAIQVRDLLLGLKEALEVDNAAAWEAFTKMWNGEETDENEVKLVDLARLKRTLEIVAFISGEYHEETHRNLCNSIVSIASAADEIQKTLHTKKPATALPHIEKLQADWSTVTEIDGIQKLLLSESQAKEKSDGPVDDTRLPRAGETGNPAQSQTGSIEGRIIDIPTGRGISGVLLTATPRSSPASDERFTCTSGKDGAFALRDLKNGEYLLQGNFPSVDVDVVSGQCTRDVLIGVDRRNAIVREERERIGEHSDTKIKISIRVIEMPANAMKDAFESDERLSSGLLVRNGYDIADRLLTLTNERKDAKLIVNPHLVMFNNGKATVMSNEHREYISGYEPVEGEPSKLTPQHEILKAGWKHKIYAGIVDSGEEIHIELAAWQQTPDFETRQYQPGYEYQIPSPPDIFVAEMTAKSSEPMVIGRLRHDETAQCFILTPSVIWPERKPEPLLGKELPAPDNMEDIEALKQAEGRPLLICFWDMNQRPSRNLVEELAKREKELTDKNVTVLLIHTSGVDPAKLREWLDNRNISFACGIIKSDAKEVLFRWGVRAQPWLILTDEEGIVRAEGFDLEQLDDKLRDTSKPTTVGTRILHFPQDRTVGNLKIRDSRPELEWDRGYLSQPGWSLLGPAQGDVSITEGEDLRLEVLGDVTDLSFLDALKPNDLQVLLLSHKKISDEDLASLKDLTGLLALNLDSTPIEGAGLAHLAALTSLKELSLFNTQVSDAGLEHLSALKSLKRLNLFITKIKGPGLKHLQNLTSLVSLDLAATPITDAALEHVGRMTWLKELQLQDTDITDKGLAHLKSLHSLEMLVLGNADLKPGYSPITDDGLVHLKEMDSLEYLHLMRTLVTGAGLAHLRNLKALKTVKIAEIRITARDIEFLKKETTGLSDSKLDEEVIGDMDVKNLEMSFSDHTMSAEGGRVNMRSPAPSGVDKSIVKIECLVGEVFSEPKMDRETIIAIENLLGGKITLPDSPAAADLLKKAAQATAMVKDKRVTQKQFNGLVDLLLSRGFVKILLCPTMEVADGQTATIRSSEDHIEDLIQITPTVRENGSITLQANLDLTLKSAEPDVNQPPNIRRLKETTRVNINPGQSWVVEEMKAVEKSSGAREQKSKLLVILTPSLVSPDEPKEPMETLNFQNVEVRTVIEKLAAWTGKTIIPPDELMKQKITIYSPEKMPRSEAAGMILGALYLKGYTAEKTEDTIYLKPLPEEQTGTEAKDPPRQAGDPRL